MANIFPINGWNGRARVDIAPREPAPASNVSPIPDDKLPGVVLRMTEHLPPHVQRQIAGEMQRRAFDAEHADLDFIPDGAA